jgi:CheY-like chemotaxis protein
MSQTRVTTLVVDDSPFMLKILTQILEAAGDFDLVGTATNGCQALRYVSMLSPDLVLMDIHMPGLNGIQVTRSIKQSEHPPVVILTSSDDRSVTKTTAEQAGADAFVSKEGNLRYRLMGALQNLFGQRGEKREAVGISFQNRLTGYSKREHGT